MASRLEQGVPKDLYKGSRRSRSTSRTLALPPLPNRRRPRPPKAKKSSQKKGRQPPATPAPRLRLTRAARPILMWPHGRRQRRRVPAGAETKKIARKRTTAPRPTSRPSGRASTIVTTICCAIPGADAKRHLYALDLFPRH